MNTFATVPIGDLVTIYGGGTPTRSNPVFYGGNIPWVTPKDMKSWEISDTQITITPQGLEESTTRLVPASSVLLVVRSGVLKHSLPIAISRRPVTINQDMKALVSNEKLLPEYLARFLQASAPIVLQWVRATTADNFPIDNLRALEIPLPPLDEQRHIAALLDAADALRVKRGATLVKLDTLAQSIFIEMFGELLVAQSRVPLAYLVDDFRYGTSNKSEESGYPALRIPNVIGGALDLSELKRVPVDDAELTRLRLRAGDVLFVRTNGNPDYVGRCAVFDPERLEAAGHDPTDWIYASYLIRARPRHEKLHAVYLREFLSTAEGRRALRKRSKTSAGQYNINTESLGELPIPLPTLEAQKAFAHKIEALATRNQSYESSRVCLDRLFASLQHRAFKGGL